MHSKQLLYSTLITFMIAGLFVVGASRAATDTTTFTVTATVNDACSVTATNLAFGNYDPNSGTADLATSTVTATCTLLTPYSIGLDTGSGISSTTTRTMTGAVNAEKLDYELYSDVTRTAVWTDLAGANPVTGVGAGLTGVPHIVYGSIPAGQGVSADSYSDTINVTLEF